MADVPTSNSPPIVFATHPSRYHHWKLTCEGEVARLHLACDTQHAQRPGYELKLNSYDLAVDIELADAIERLRFEHPEVKAVVVSSDRERIFCSGANIFMLASSSHPFKVNFCKYTNETRLTIEDASQQSGQKYLAAVNGPCAGGGYELALACDEILLIDDGNSTVSLPEVPLLGVLPGTGGLTRVVDKRKVRRDLADIFCTLAEGIKGKRAAEWNLVDHVAPRSRFSELVAARAKALAAQGSDKPGPGLELVPIECHRHGDRFSWRHVELSVDRQRRVAELVLTAPSFAPPQTLDGILAQGVEFWPFALSRELDQAILELRFNFEDIGLIVVKTRGEAAHVQAAEAALDAHQAHWLVREMRLHLARTLRRLETSGRSFFAIADAGSCFVGVLFEVALACDRLYMLDDGQVAIALGPLSGGALPMWNGLSRLESRFLGEPGKAKRVLGEQLGQALDAQAALSFGLCTVAADEIDFDDELRVAIEERASLSPDALTGMEASLRLAGPETLATKIFGRLSAWQNWIFTRSNATGDTGALTMYGRPERPSFDWRRT